MHFKYLLIRDNMLVFEIQLVFIYCDNEIVNFSFLFECPLRD